jgi:hypothetical protein
MKPEGTPLTRGQWGVRRAQGICESQKSLCPFSVSVFVFRGPIELLRLAASAVKRRALCLHDADDF